MSSIDTTKFLLRTGKCKNCGGSVGDSQQGQDKIFCCEECRWDYHNEVRSSGAEVTHCVVCDAKLPPRDGKRGRPPIYCKKKCAQEARNRKGRMQRASVRNMLMEVGEYQRHRDAA